MRHAGTVRPIVLIQDACSSRRPSLVGSTASFQTSLDRPADGAESVSFMSFKCSKEQIGDTARGELSSQLGKQTGGSKSSQSNVPDQQLSKSQQLAKILKVKTNKKGSSDEVNCGVCFSCVIPDRSYL